MPGLPDLLPGLSSEQFPRGKTVGKVSVETFIANSDYFPIRSSSGPVTHSGYVKEYIGNDKHLSSQEYLKYQSNRENVRLHCWPNVNVRLADVSFTKL